MANVNEIFDGLLASIDKAVAKNMTFDQAIRLLEVASSLHYQANLQCLGPVSTTEEAEAYAKTEAAEIHEPRSVMTPMAGYDADGIPLSDSAPPHGHEQASAETRNAFHNFAGMVDTAYKD